MIGVSRTTHLQWQYLCVYIHYYSPCFACRYNLNNKNISSLKTNKRFWKVFNYSNSHWLKWVPKKLDPERSSDKMLLNFLYIGSTWLWYVCVAVCNNNFKRKHDLCQAQHPTPVWEWYEIKYHGGVRIYVLIPLVLIPNGERVKPWRSMPTYLLFLKDNSRWYDDGA